MTPAPPRPPADDGGCGRRRLDLRAGPRARRSRRRRADGRSRCSGRRPMRRSCSGGAVPRPARCCMTGLPLDWLAERPARSSAPVRHSRRWRAARSAPISCSSTRPALAACARFRRAGGRRLPFLRRHLVAGGAGTVPLPPDFAGARELLRARAIGAATPLVAPTAAFAAATAQAYGLPARACVVHNGRRRGRAAMPRARRTSCFTAGRLWDEGKDAAHARRAAALLRLPVLAAGPVAGPNGAAVDAAASAPARPARRGGDGAAASRAARSSSPPRATSPSAWRCWKRRRPAARWCCPTSRASASSGTAPPIFVAAER